MSERFWAIRMSSLVLSVNDNHWTVGWNFASGFPCSYYLKCFKAACLVKSLVKVLKPLIIGKFYFLKPPIIGNVYVYIIIYRRILQTPGF